VIHPLWPAQAVTSNVMASISVRATTTVKRPAMPVRGMDPVRGRASSRCHQPPATMSAALCSPDLISINHIEERNND
jgi:hypothetical protein